MRAESRVVTYIYFIFFKFTFFAFLRSTFPNSEFHSPAPAVELRGDFLHVVLSSVKLESCTNFSDVWFVGVAWYTYSDIHLRSPHGV